MGNFISYSVAAGVRAAQAQEYDVKPRTLKIQSKGIPDFNGSTDSWTKWRTNAYNVFIAGGYKDILASKEHSQLHVTDNEVVYTLLAGATLDGTARHIVTKFDVTKDGHAAWISLTTLFDGSSRQLSTAKRLRSKLQNTYLYAGNNAARYIDIFMETYRDLQFHDGNMSEATAIDLFLDNIHDPEYTAWKIAVKLLKQMDLDVIVHAFRERSDEIDNNKKDTKLLKNHIRRLTGTKHTRTELDSDGDSSPTRTPKRTRRRQSRTRIRRTKLDIIPQESGLLSIDHKDWLDLTTEEKQFIQEYNAKIKHKEPVTSLTSPQTIQIIARRQITPMPEDSMSDSSASITETPPASARKRKNITMNIHGKEKQE